MSSIEATRWQPIQARRLVSMRSLAAVLSCALLGLPKEEKVGDEWLDIELATLHFY